MTATSIAYADLLARTRGVIAVAVLAAMFLTWLWFRARGARGLRRLADDLAEVIGR